MKTLVFLYFLFGSILSDLCFAEPIRLDTLTSFADQYSYSDNRNSIGERSIYSASKNCCGSAPYSVVEGYPQKNGFKQVALWCDHCGVKKISSMQVLLCRNEFTQLYKALTGKEATEILASLVGTDNKRLYKASLANIQIKFSTGSLKCDSKGGKRIRVDYFAR